MFRPTRATLLVVALVLIAISGIGVANAYWPSQTVDFVIVGATSVDRLPLTVRPTDMGQVIGLQPAARVITEAAESGRVTGLLRLPPESLPTIGIAPFIRVKTEAAESSSTLFLGPPSFPMPFVGAEPVFRIMTSGAEGYRSYGLVEPPCVPGFNCVGADLSLTKVDTPDPVAAGSNLAYDLVVTNAFTGSGTATGVILTDFLPVSSSFVAALNGAQEVPRVTIPATGSGTFTLNTTHSELDFQVTVDAAQLSGPIAAAHIHNAPPGEDGPIVRDLGFTGGTASGVWTSTDLQPLTPALVDELLAGNLYVNVHTAANSGGEIRGQIIPAPTGGVIIVSATPTQGICAQEGGTVTCSLGDLQAGSTVSVEIVVTVDPATPEGTILTNIASVSANETDANLSNNTATVTTRVLLPQDIIEVTSTADTVAVDGSCSLREAIVNANNDNQAGSTDCLAGDGADVISLPAGTYTLAIPGIDEDAAATGDLDITDDLTIIGADRETVIIDGNGLDRVFHILPEAISEISNVTIENGDGGTSSGGGLRNVGTLTLTNSTVRNNVSNGNGGGIRTDGTMIVNLSTVEGNTAENGAGIQAAPGSTSYVTGSIITRNMAGGGSGGIGNHGELILDTSTISHNIANDSGGGVRNEESGTMMISRSTVRNNSAFQFAGGGINNSGVLTADNSTISGNEAGGAGGGLNTTRESTANLTNLTVADNAASRGGGIFIRPEATVHLKNSIIAGNDSAGGPTDGDCSGIIVSHGHNLISAAAGCVIEGDATGNITGSDPLLDSLRDNGGPTHTQALIPGSPAIDVVPEIDCIDLTGDPVTTDQRGTARPQVAGCDIGAFERAPSDPLPPNGVVGGETTLQFRASTGGRASLEISCPSFEAVTVPGEDGRWQFAGVPEETCTLTAAGPGYLKARGTLTVDRPDVTAPANELLAGDANTDGFVALNDITGMIAQFTQSTVNCAINGNVVDVNCDGVVALNDITSAIANFAKTTQPFPTS